MPEPELVTTLSRLFLHTCRTYPKPALLKAKVKGRAFAAEVDPRAKPGALTRDVNTRLSTAETDPQTKPALIRFANEDCKAWSPCRRPGRRGKRRDDG